MNRTIALVAHDNRKKDLIEWVEFNKGTLLRHKLICTGTTGRMVEAALMQNRAKNEPLPEITLLKSGPLGGDQQLGALICEGKVDMLFFLWDPMQPQPHDVDVKALLRISSLYNIPTATNRSTADFIISSPLFEGEYKPQLKNFSDYLGRSIDL
ncbi:MAG: methylglyoxal synthase [Bacteroidetes bacterium HGW-Bacteroidetes-7]|jgi:methylglyoxal synthase|nr:MAG: methylglyoxal synthase [Bacteroidetes bacterium HGW-Bacteroidetes-7]